MTQVKNRDSRRSYNTQIIAAVFLGLEPRLVCEPPSDKVHAAYYKDMKKKIMRALLVCRHVRLTRCPHHNTKYRPAYRLFWGRSVVHGSNGLPACDGA
jgi:hypothetical protein